LSLPVHINNTKKIQKEMKNMFKKLSTWAAVVIVLSMLLAACAPAATPTAAPAPTQATAATTAPEVVQATNPPAATAAPVATATTAPAPAEKVTLTFMNTLDPAQAGPLDAYQPALKKWMAENPNVTLQQDVMSHDEYETKFRTLAAADQLSDVFYINGNMIVALGDGGKLHDFAPDLTSDATWKAGFNPGSFPEYVRGDKTYAIPAQEIVTHLIYYNTDIFKAAGINTFPTTWADFIAAIKTLKAAGYTPLAMGDKGKWLMRDPLFGTLANRYTGTDWLLKTEVHQAKWTDPEFVAALNGFKEMVDAGAFNADATAIDDSQMLTLYYNKKAAMFIDGNWAGASVDKDAPKDVAAATEIAMVPAVPDGKGAPNATVTTSGWGWGINANLSGAKLAAAVSLVKALSSVEFGKAFIESGNLAAQVVPNFDQSKLTPTVAKVDAFIQTTVGCPHLTIPFPPAIDDILATGLQDMLVGAVTPDQLAGKLQAEWDKSQ
jgi:raffinose/stachyose/melibiose transport system substrate-binding protein